MKYFTQLIKSYSRLHEAEQQLDPAAQQTALNYYTQANSSMIPLGGGNAPGIPVKELNGLIYKNREGKVIFNGFPGSRPAREINPQGADQSRENFNEFVSMLAAGTGGAPAATDETPAPGVADPAEAIPGSEPEIISSRRLEKLLEKICGDKKASRESKSRCNYLRLNLKKLTNSRSDSIFSTIKKATSIIVSCLSSGLSQCKKESDKQSQIHKDAAYKTLKEVSNLLMDVIEKKDGVLTVEDVALLNSRINMQGNQIAIIDREGNGMMITQYPDRSQMISSLLGALISQVKDENGESFEFKSDLVKFLSEKGVGPGGAPARGFLFEQLVAASNDYVSCQSEQDQEAKRSCIKSVNQRFLSYVNGKDNLNEALMSLAKSLMKDGEVATAVDDDISNEFLKDIVIPALLANGGTEEIKAQLSLAGRVMGALSSMGALIRKPFKTDTDLAKNVGEGRRADNMEIYKTEEEARQALARQNLPNDIMKEIDIVKVKGGYGIGNGLKWTSSGDDVKAGEVSPKNILKAIKGKVTDSVKSWHKAMQKYMGVTDSQRKAFGDRVEKSEKLNQKLLSIKDNVKTKGANKDKITVNQREEAVKMIKDQVLEITGMDPNDPLVRHVIAEFRKGALDQDNDWEGTCKLLTNALSKASLRKRLNSSDPKEVESAFDEMTCMSAYAAVASDNTLLSVANGRTGNLHTTVHNVQMRKAAERLNNFKKAILKGTPEEKEAALKEISINEKSITFGKDYKLDATGYSASFHINKKLFNDPETCSTNSIRGMEVPEKQPENASTVIDRDQLMKFLVEQKTTLDRMISIIAKDGLN